MNDHRYAVIEVFADYIYFVAGGTQEDINKFTEELNNSIKNLNNSNTTYISCRLDIPLSVECENLDFEKLNINKNIELATYIETTQSYVFAQGFKKNTYVVMQIEKYNDKTILTYPKIDLKDDDDPELLIFDWIKKKVKKIPKGIKKTIKPITLVGQNEEILVYVAKLQ